MRLWETVDGVKLLKVVGIHGTFAEHGWKLVEDLVGKFGGKPTKIVENVGGKHPPENLWEMHMYDGSHRLHLGGASAAFPSVATGTGYDSKGKFTVSVLRDRAGKFLDSDFFYKIFYNFFIKKSSGIPPENTLGEFQRIFREFGGWVPGDYLGQL